MTTFEKETFGFSLEQVVSDYTENLKGNFYRDALIKETWQDLSHISNNRAKVKKDLFGKNKKMILDEFIMLMSLANEN